jgi:hypothetical protein
MFFAYMILSKFYEEYRRRGAASGPILVERRHAAIHALPLLNSSNMQTPPDIFRFFFVRPRKTLSS